MPPEIAGAATPPVNPPAIATPPGHAPPDRGNEPADIEIVPDDMFDEESPGAAPKSQDEPAPKEAPKEMPKETTGETPKEAPKEIPKEEPKETPKEAPKEEPKDAKKSAEIDPEKLPKGFRRELDRVNSLRQQLTEERDQLKTRVEELEKSSSETKQFNEVLEARDKRIQELEAKVVSLNYQESADYQQKMEKFNKLASETHAEITELDVVSGHDEQGNPITRKATWDDFIGLWKLGGTISARAAASRVFGSEVGPLIAERLGELTGMEREMKQAVEEHQKNHKQKESEQIANRTKVNQETEKLWLQVNKELAEKKPDIYGDDPQDKDSNELREKTRAGVDYYFANRAKMSTEDAILREAQIRLDAIAAPVLSRKVGLLQAEVEDLKAYIAKLEASDPGTEPHRPGGGPEIENQEKFEQDLDRQLQESFD